MKMPPMSSMLFVGDRNLQHMSMYYSTILIHVHVCYSAVYYIALYCNAIHCSMLCYVILCFTSMSCYSSSSCICLCNARFHYAIPYCTVLYCATVNNLCGIIL